MDMLRPFKIIRNENTNIFDNSNCINTVETNFNGDSTVIEGDCEVSLHSSSQQPPIKYVNCDRLQPRIEPVT